MIRAAIPWLVGFVLFGCMVLFCAGLDVSVKVLVYAVAGWAFYLGRVLPDVTINWTYIAEGVIALAALTVGVHWFAAWLYRETRIATTSHGDSNSEPTGALPRVWRPRWSVSIVAVVISMFVAGISMVGVTHNVVWLLTGPEPILEGGGHSSTKDHPARGAVTRRFATPCAAIRACHSEMSVQPKICYATSPSPKVSGTFG